MLNLSSVTDIHAINNDLIVWRFGLKGFFALLQFSLRSCNSLWLNTQSQIELNPEWVGLTDVILFQVAQVSCLENAIGSLKQEQKTWEQQSQTLTTQLAVSQEKV